MEKDLEKTRIENERKEERKMWDAINKNHKKAYKRYVAEQQKNKIMKQKQEKKETIIDFVFIVVVFMALLGLMATMLIWLHKDNEEFMNTCTSKGYSETWCASELGL